MGTDVRINFYDLICFLIQKKCLCIVDLGEERVQIAGKNIRGGGVVAFATFNDPPIRREDVFVPYFKLEELSRCLGFSLGEL